MWSQIYQKKKIDGDEHEKLPNRSKIKLNKLETIFVARDNKIEFTCFWIFTKNYFIAGNHP